MLFFPIQYTEDEIIVTNGNDQFFSLLDYNGNSYLLSECYQCGYNETRKKYRFCLKNNINKYRVTEVYTINQGIKCFMGYTFGEKPMICENGKQFYDVINKEIEEV